MSLVVFGSYSAGAAVTALLCGIFLDDLDPCDTACLVAGWPIWLAMALVVLPFWGFWNMGRVWRRV